MKALMTIRMLDKPNAYGALSFFLPCPTDQGYAGFMGSMVSLKNMRYLSGEKESGGRGAGGSQSAAISDVQKRQLFTQTGI